MARIPTSIQEARAMLMAGTAGAEELAAARKLVQEMGGGGSTMASRLASAEELSQAKKLQMKKQGVTPEAAPEMMPTPEAPVSQADIAAKLRGEAPKPVDNLTGDAGELGVKLRRQAEADKARASQATMEAEAQARQAKRKSEELGKPQTAEEIIGGASDKAKQGKYVSPQDKAKQAQAEVDQMRVSGKLPERPVPSDLNTPIEPKVSQEDLAKKVLGKDAPVEDVVKPSIETPKKGGIIQKIKDNPIKSGIAAVGAGTVIANALGSKSDRGKPAATPPPDKGGVPKPEAPNPNLAAEADNTADRGLSREEELKQQAAAQALRPEPSPEEKALKTKQEAFDAVMAEGNALDKQGEGGFWRGVGKFFGDKGPEDFFSYATDTKGYLAREAQKAKEARMAGNLEATKKINDDIAGLKAAQTSAAAVNQRLMDSIRDNDTKRYVANLRQKQGDTLTALAIKMSTLPDGTVDYSKMPEAIAKLNAAQSYGKMQGVMQGAQGLPLE